MLAPHPFFLMPFSLANRNRFQTNPSMHQRVVVSGDMG